MSYSLHTTGCKLSIYSTILIITYSETQGIEMPNGYLRSTQYDYSDRNVYPFDYKSSQVDPYIQELLKEIEFLKKENKRLSSYYLDTIEQEEATR